MNFETDMDGKPIVKALRLIWLLNRWRSEKVVASVYRRSLRMISVVAQERLLGAALGAAFAGGVVFEQRKSIHQTLSQHQCTQPSPDFETKDTAPPRKQVRHLWNTAVDQTLGPVIAFLSSRGW